MNCTVEGCTQAVAVKKRGLCRRHYVAWQRSVAPPCKVDSCDEPSVSQGYCSAHYQKFRTYGDPLAQRKVPNGTYGPACSIDGCENDQYARGWCETHYARWRRHGDPLETKAGPYGGGWINDDGYHMIRRNGHAVAEHRHVMATALGRALGRHEDVHHKNENKVDNRRENLEPLSKSEHSKLHHPATDVCRKGHPRTEANTYWQNGKRSCRPCKLEYMRRYKKEKND